MSLAGIMGVEAEFIQQAAPFVDHCLRDYGAHSLSELDSILHRPPIPIAPIVLKDYRALTVEEKSGLISAYQSETGVAYFIAINADAPSRATHSLFDITAQLADDLALHFPLVHPQEGHPESVRRFGPPDHTVKIYDLPGRGAEKGYREQAETSELFAMHHDGLGSGGTVQTAVLYCDECPLWGGLTCFTNILRLGLELARDDFEAFQTLFLPDALTIIRPRGKGAIKVVTPALFMNTQHRPQSFVRVASGEYQVSWRHDLDACRRAQAFMEQHLRPLAPSSSFINMSAKGHGCLIRNQAVAHSRTTFIDHLDSGKVRLLSRKWYMSAQEHGVYKHVPGMFVDSPWGQLVPQRFGSEVLWGEWRYDRDTDENKLLEAAQPLDAQDARNQLLRN